MTFVRAGGYFAFLALFLFIHKPASAAGPDVHTVTFDRSMLAIENIDGYDRINYPGLEPTRRVGYPRLPAKLIYLHIPPGREIAGISIVSAETETIAGRFTVFPVQTPQPLSRSNYRFVPPEKHIYESGEPYPPNPAAPAAGGYLAGQNIGSVLFYPVQYTPASRQLVFHRQITIQINYRDSGRQPLPYRPTAYSDHVRRALVSNLVKDPRPVLYKQEPPRTASAALPAGEHAYVIVTSEALESAFQPLADWKYQKGLGATMVTTNWIYRNYSGSDNPAKVRNFLKDAYQNWGTVWVLLAGDDRIVPTRFAFAFDCETANPDDNNIPCDLYYSDLDGSWNANGNSFYGEVGDNVDMYPDVFVGRASVEDTVEASAFVNKLISYEHSLQGSERSMLFLASILWDLPYTNSALSKDLIDDLYVPPRFDPITKLYEADGNEDYNSAMGALQAGHHIINHCGHAYTQTLQAGTGYLMDYDMDALDNGPHYSILFSIGCWPAAFDTDCIAEHFIQRENGGGVAFVGNSRYGWGSPGNPLYGYSDRFDQQFFKELLVEDNYHIGRTLAAAKAVFVPLAGQENVYRWCEYELNLLGDPEMMIWTDDGANLTVEHPAELAAGESHCPVLVTAGGSPVAGAQVCLMQGAELYESGFTAQDGRAAFDVVTSNPVDPITVTVTAHNCFPYTGAITITGDGPYVRISSYSMNNSPAGLVTPGDAVLVEASFTNFGADTAFQVSADLLCAHLQATLTDSHELIDFIAPGQSRHFLDVFSFETSPALADGEVIRFNAAISDLDGHTWTDIICATGARPLLSFGEYQVTDEAHGDGDGLIEAGETIRLDMLVRNTGRRSAELVEATFTSRHPQVEVLNNPVIYWSVPAGGHGQVPVNVRVDPGCPEPAFPVIDVAYECRDGFTAVDSIVLSVGPVGFHDDMESGDIGWSLTGTYNHWHLSSLRCHSGTTSWYAGHEILRHYMSGASNAITSPPIVIGQDSELSFWCWYEFPNYGTDGFYVKVHNGLEWVTLDFVGSGGALGALPTGNTWLEYTYDLSRIPAGTTIYVRFNLISDIEGVLEEGVYIDDVSIRRSSSGDMITTVPPGVGLTPVTDLHQNYPNPFNPVTTIAYSLDRPDHVNIAVFNIQGARVRTLLSGPATAGPHIVTWDGRDDRGEAVSSGVYFYRMKTGAFTKTRKMVLIR